MHSVARAESFHGKKNTLFIIHGIETIKYSLKITEVVFTHR